MRNCTWSLNDKVRDNSQTSPAVLISSTRRILTQRFSEQDLAPFMIHELLLSPTETASGSHPCCVVSVTYHRPSYFHGGNTGSNPVRDPNLINTLHEIWRAFPLFHGMVCIASSGSLTHGDLSNPM